MVVKSIRHFAETRIGHARFESILYQCQSITTTPHEALLHFIAIFTPTLVQKFLKVPLNHPISGVERVLNLRHGNLINRKKFLVSILRFF